MFFIPGQFISLLTIPGIIVHEFAHKKFCDWFGVKVHEVVYFKFGRKVPGYVIHDVPKSFKQTFFISVGPLIVNSFGCIILSFLSSFLNPQYFIKYLILYLALAIGAHSFPSDQDAKNILERSKIHIKEDGSMIHYLSYPFFILIYIANKLTIFWFDFIYAFLLLHLGGGV